MKILLISNLFPPEFLGGYELAARDVARGLALRGHEVMVLTAPMIGVSSDPPEPFVVARSLYCATETMEFELREERRIRGGICNIHNIKVLGRVLETFAPDGVLCFNLAGLSPYPILILLARLRYTPVIYMGDNMFGRGLDGIDERKNFLSFFDIQHAMSHIRFLPVSELVRDEVATYLGFPIQRDYIVPGWIDARLVDGPAPAAAEGAGARFVFSSRIAPHKGIDIVIEACAKLVKRGYREFSVDLYGAGEVAITLQKIKLHGLEDVVRFGGSLDKATMLRTFATYDYLLFPTWEREPFGFVAAEAAYQGCLPIMSAGCGASEWFRDGVDCLKIERTGDSLADAMIYLMETDPRTVAGLKQATRKMARKCFDFEYWMGRIEETAIDSRRRDAQPSVADAVNALTVQLRLWL